MLNLTLTVILHAITLTGHLGTIDSASCLTTARALSGDNWVVSCTNNPVTSGITNWTVGECTFSNSGNVSCP